MFVPFTAGENSMVSAGTTKN